MADDMDKEQSKSEGEPDEEAKPKSLEPVDVPTPKIPVK